ncbi:MAG: DUF4234 domain-containing protein [Firmicutes bacterium]|nr:DUF4234 domain-containing protein [[Eubacterium] siraeum]MCM1488320.1 DUF4234 domain-containing protein [Bacillota bacterium]
MENEQYQQPQYQPQYQQPQYQQPQYRPQYQQPVVYQQNVYQQPVRPVVQLKTNKALWKYILFNLLTFGIYSLVVMSSVSDDINIIASRYDGRKTMHYCLLFFIIAPLTLGIGGIVWYHRISSRIGGELQRRYIPYSFSAVDYWLWCVLGCLILVGPFIYMHKMFKATNLLCQSYNLYG